MVTGNLPWGRLDNQGVSAAVQRLFHLTCISMFEQRQKKQMNKTEAEGRSSFYGFHQLTPKTTCLTETLSQNIQIQLEELR